MEEQLLRITGEIGPPPKCELLDDRRRETVRSLAKLPYLLSFPLHDYRFGFEKLGPFYPNCGDRHPNGCGPFAHRLRVGTFSRLACLYAVKLFRVNNFKARQQFAIPVDFGVFYK